MKKRGQGFKTSEVVLKKMCNEYIRSKLSQDEICEKYDVPVHRFKYYWNQNKEAYLCRLEKK